MNMGSRYVKIASNVFVRVPTCDPLLRPPFPLTKYLLR